MPLNQTSILTSAQGRQLAQRRWQAAASVPAVSSSPVAATTDIAKPPTASVMRAAAMAGFAGLAAFVFCEWIRRRLLRSAGTQSSQPLQDAPIGILGQPPQIAVSNNGQGWSVLIALAIVIWVFISFL